MSSEAAAGRVEPLSRVPAPALVLGAVTSVQLGAAVAKSLFPALTPPGVAFCRLTFAAAALGLLWRPRLRGRSRGDLRLAAVFGLTLAAMNTSFYEALDRVPLGVAVTLEFVGPLGVAVAGSRRPRDFLWVAMAAGGVVLLADRGGGHTEPLGVALALLAGCCWAVYILLGVRVGRAFAGSSGLTLATAAGALVVAPAGISSAGSHLLHPGLLAAGAGVGVLSSALPWSLELEALRRLPTRVFGVLMSLEPAIAALSGFVVLGERLAPRALGAIALVVCASLGSSRPGRATAPPDV